MDTSAYLPMFLAECREHLRIRMYLDGLRVTSREAGGGKRDLLGAVAVAA